VQEAYFGHDAVAMLTKKATTLRRGETRSFAGEAGAMLDPVPASARRRNESKTHMVKRCG
jgi:hypothetical protein